MIVNRYWHSPENVKEYVREKCLNRIRTGNFLEVGPGDKPFDFLHTTHTVDMVGEPTYTKDVCMQRLPNMFFDFVYCSHMLEDCTNPEFVCREIKRVGYSGYIETPSVCAEFCREVEADGVKYRGHHHHRWFIWHEGNTLYLLPKYPIVEYMDFDESILHDTLNENPLAWVNCFLWDDSFEVKHLKHNIDFNIREDYSDMIVRGMNAGLKNSQAFLDEVKAIEEIKECA